MRVGRLIDSSNGHLGHEEDQVVKLKSWALQLATWNTNKASLNKGDKRVRRRFCYQKNPLKSTLAQVEGYCRTAGLKEVSAEARSVENGQRNGSATLLRVTSRLKSCKMFLIQVSAFC